MDFSNITSWSQLLLAIAVVVLVTVVIPLLPQLKDFVIAFLQAKIAEVQARQGNETSAHYVKILNDTVYDVVNELNQTAVDALKELAKDGKLTKEQQDKYKQEALNKVLGTLSAKGIEALKEVYTDLNAAVITKIESNVRNNHLPAASALLLGEAFKSDAGESTDCKAAVEPEQDKENTAQ